MRTIECNFGDVIFYINTFNEGDYLQQIKHVNRYYIRNKIPKKNVNEFNINYETDQYIFKVVLEECKKRKGKMYQAFENEIYKEIKGKNGKIIYYLINCEDYICVKENEYNYRIIANGSKKGEKWPFRLIRELLVRERESQGKLFMHGTGIKLEKRGVLLLGNSGSGKTTLALNLLLRENIDKGFISNDRVFLENNDMYYFPIPIVLASGTVKNNMRLNEYCMEKRVFENEINKKLEEIGNNEKAAIPLTDIEKIYSNLKTESKYKTDIIVFPTIISEMGDKYEIEKMKEKEKYIGLDRTCFSPFDSESLRLEWIKKRTISNDRLYEIKYDMFHSIIKDKEIFSLKYGINVDKDKIYEDIIR